LACHVVSDLSTTIMQQRDEFGFCRRRHNKNNDLFTQERERKGRVDEDHSVRPAHMIMDPFLAGLPTAAQIQIISLIQMKEHFNIKL
jgi:hypothetical protein